MIENSLRGKVFLRKLVWNDTVRRQVGWQRRLASNGGAEHLALLAPASTNREPVLSKNAWQLIDVT
jgi:hypothetical protein